jgi:hypothetical protein
MPLPEPLAPRGMSSGIGLRRGFRHWRAQTTSTRLRKVKFRFPGGRAKKRGACRAAGRGDCRGLSSDARRLRPQRLPMSRAIRGALWRSALWMAGCRHLPQLREVWRAHVVHVPLLLTQHATVDEGRWARLRAAWRGE